jgi:maltose O-acetyltransferase
MKFFIFLVYRSIAMHLPKSNKPYVGSICKLIRGTLASKIFEKAGKNINIERGAKFAYRNNIRIGDNSGIGINANIPPNISIGDNVMMGPDCIIYAANHKFSDITIPMNEQGHSPVLETVIGNDVWIGGRVIMLPGKIIGNGVIIGAGSIVTKNLDDYGIYGGNPAKLIKKRI